MSNLVLVEQLSPLEADIIQESRDDGKNHFLSGCFMVAETVNGNGRNYPQAEIARAVEEVNGRIQSGYTICGELNHPSDLQVNLERVSHIITEMRMDGNKAIGKAKILNTPMGVLVKNLIEGGVKLGVSSRGSGSVNEGRVSDFNFVTVDIVYNPSGPGCYPNVIKESQENPKIMTLAEAVVHDPDAQKYLKLEILKFMEEMRLQKR
jgi:hypothetical protein